MAKENFCRLLRIANNMNITKMAAEMQTTPSYLGEIESGKRKPSSDFLKRYSKVLGIRESTLLHLYEENELHDLNYQELLMMILKELTPNLKGNALMLDEKTALAMAAGASSILDNKRLQGTIYIWDYFGRCGGPKELSYYESAKILYNMAQDFLTPKAAEKEEQPEHV